MRQTKQIKNSQLHFRCGSSVPLTAAPPPHFLSPNSNPGPLRDAKIHLGFNSLVPDCLLAWQHHSHSPWMAGSGTDVGKPLSVSQTQPTTCLDCSWDQNGCCVSKRFGFWGGEPKEKHELVARKHYLRFKNSVSLVPSILERQSVKHWPSGPLLKNVNFYLEAWEPYCPKFLVD